MTGRGVLPIRMAEFKAALRATGLRLGVPERPRSVGLAISGGVDSMALAHLCKSFEQQNGRSLKFKALVVDHMARPGSTQEARTVASRLRKMGMPTTILKLNWKDAEHPLQLPNFETKARTKRYRAFVQACKHLKLRALLVGHHNDDQAETVLMRIVGGYMGNGLQAMKPCSSSPEGRSDIVADSSSPTSSTESGRNETSEFAPPSLKIYRPLLGFSKERLIATCDHFEVAWVEDHTNFNASLTLRNSVRHLLAQNQLPHALRKAPLLYLAEAKRTSVDAVERYASDVLERVQFQDIDLRSGKLVFFTRSSNEVGLSDLEVEADRRSNHVGVAEAVPTALLKIVSLVSPMDKISIDDLNTAVYAVFPGLLSSAAAPNSATRYNELHFTTCGVEWHGEPLQLESEIMTIWTLTRQPYKRTDPGPQLTWTPSSVAEPNMPKLGDWQLFDNRFWMKVHHDLGKRVHARPLRPTDMETIKSSFTEGESIAVRRTFAREFSKKLAATAPKKSRWTLPALVKDLDGPVLALPTLGLYAQGLVHGLRWRTMYKHVQLPKQLKTALNVPEESSEPDITMREIAEAMLARL